MSRPSKRHRNDDGPTASNRSLSHTGPASEIDEDDDEWAVRDEDEGDTYNMQHDHDPNDWALDEIGHDQERSLSQDVSNDWALQQDDEDDEESLPQDYEHDDWAVVEDQASATSGRYNSDSDTSEMEDDEQHQGRLIDAAKTTRRMLRDVARKVSSLPQTPSVQVPQSVNRPGLMRTEIAAAETTPLPPPESAHSQAYGLSVDITSGDGQPRQEAMPSRIDMLRAEVFQHRSNATFYRLRMHQSLMAAEGLEKVLYEALASKPADQISPALMTQPNGRSAESLVAWRTACCSRRMVRTVGVMEYRGSTVKL